MVYINNDIKEDSCLLYKTIEGEGSFLVGVIKNELAFLDVRVQIAEQKLSGYYILFKGGRYYINDDGRLPDYPNDLFPSFLSLISKLV